jgi:glycosyltransferase involved in cell wall biosynthesis
MNILILNWRDIKHPLAGGAEISLMKHAVYWKRHGAQVTWFSSAVKNRPVQETIDGISIVRQGSHFTVHIYAMMYYLKQQKDTVDIVIDSFHFIPFFSPLYISRKKIIALINEIAEKVWFQNLPYPIALIGYYLEPFFFKLYKSIPFISGSSSTKHDLIKVGISKSEIYVIHHGIDHPKKISEEASREFSLVFLGRISQDKGIIDALETLELVSHKFQKVSLWIIGKEERQGLLDELIEKHCKNSTGTKERIKYFGFVDDEKKFSLLQHAFVLIHPSTREGWGLNVIEANCVGTPAIGYNVSGLRDSIQDKKTGLLVAEKSPRGMADAVIKLYEKKRFYKELSNNAQKWSKQFSWDTAGEESWKIIQQKASV